MINNYSEILHYLYEHQNHRCAYCGQEIKLIEMSDFDDDRNHYYDSNEYKKLDLHHRLIHDSKVNNRRFPLLIQFVGNFQLVHNVCHIINGNKGLTDFQAEKWEQRLKQYETNGLVAYNRQIVLFEEWENEINEELRII